MERLLELKEKVEVQKKCLIFSSLVVKLQQNR